MSQLRDAARPRHDYYRVARRPGSADGASVAPSRSLALRKVPSAASRRGSERLRATLEETKPANERMPNP
jgi:hypothetical protein